MHCDEQYRDSLKEFLTPTFTNMSNSQQKKIGKKLKTYAQAIGIKSTQREIENNEENNQSKIKDTGVKNKTSKTENIQKENEFIRVINGMKEQIDKLVQIIKMMCNAIGCDDAFKQTVEEHLEEVELAIEKENDVIEEVQEERNEKNNNNMHESSNNSNDIRSKCKIRSHPYSRQNSATGSISQKMKWVRKINALNANSNEKSKPNE